MSLNFPMRIVSVSEKITQLNFLGGELELINLNVNPSIQLDSYRTNRRMIGKIRQREDSDERELVCFT